MMSWVRKPLVVLISFVAGAIATIKGIADWIGRSTAGEDTGALVSKMDNLIAWLAEQPSLLFYGVPIVLASSALVLAYKPEIVRALGIHPKNDFGHANKQVILSDPKEFGYLAATGGNTKHIYEAPAPAHSIADLRYQIEVEENMFSDPIISDKARITIREVGSSDPPILFGVGETKVKLNRHSKFELFATYPWDCFFTIRIWLLGWVED